MIQVFSRAWFVQHQRGLLALARSPVGPAIFGTDPHRHILRILPHAVVYFHDIDRSGRILFCADFRTAPTFARRLRHRLMPVWKGMHYWDALVADGLLPVLSFGFDTLIVHPDPQGAPGQNTVDGFAWRNISLAGETFGTMRGAAGTSAFDDSSNTQPTILLDSSTTTDRYNQLRRLALLFDTSSLMASASISSVTLTLHESNVADGSRNGFTDDIAASLVSVVLASDIAVVAGDYALANWGTTRFAADLPFSSWLINADNIITLNAAGRDFIDKTGITRLGWRIANDLDNSAPNWISGIDVRFWHDLADIAGTTTDPKLVVVFSVVPPADPGAAPVLEATVRRRRR